MTVPKQQIIRVYKFMAISIIVILIDISLGFFVYSQNSRHKINRTFFLLSLCLGIWNFKYLLSSLAPDAEIALVWLSNIPPTDFFIPTVFYHFILTVTNDGNRFKRILLLVSYGISVLTALLALSGKIYSGVHYTYGRFLPLITSYWSIALVNFLVLLGFYAIFILYQYVSAIQNIREKRRIVFFLFGSAIGGLCIISDLLLLTNTYRIYPFSQIGSSIFIILAAYAILKHKLIDISLVIHKSLVYSLITGFITAVFLINIILFSDLFQYITGYNSIIPSIFAAFLVSFFFQPLREKIQLAVDKSFFRERYDQQQAIRDFSSCMVTILDRQELLNSISQVISSTMHINKINIIIYNKKKKTYKKLVVSGRCYLTNGFELKEQNPIIRWLKTEKQPLLRKNLPKYADKSDSSWNYDAIKSELLKLKAELCMPLILDMRLIGILTLGKKLSDNPYNQDDIELLTVLASEASVALENANLYQETKDHLLNTVRALSAAVEAKDMYTKGHCERVIGYAAQIARALKLSPEKIEGVVFGALLHDIGKIGINEEILLKPSRLTESEFNVIKSHPLMGVKILEAVNLPSEVLDIVKYHHERFDGKGYPDGLKKDSIPLVARILAVVDAYEAMTSDRIYRSAMEQEKAIEILQEESGKQFDPQIVTIFIKLIKIGGKRCSSFHAYCTKMNNPNNSGVNMQGNLSV